jgi:magnesium-transporting ATPase (P-type)
MATLTISMYAFFSAQFGHEYGRTIAFSALVTMQWANAFNARSDEESIFVRIRTFNGKFVAGLSIAITLQMLVLFGPLGQFLHVSPVAISDLAVTGAVAFIVPILFVEIHKFIGRKYFNRTSR